jgi:DNA modification methylase
LAGPADRADGSASHPYQKSSSLLDIRVVYCGDNLEQLAKLPDACVDLIYIDPPFNSNRNYEGPSRTCHRWGETKEKRSFEDRHESTRAYIDYLITTTIWPIRHTKKQSKMSKRSRILKGSKQDSNLVK